MRAREHDASPRQRPASKPSPLQRPVAWPTTPDEAIALQRTAGNAATVRALGGPVLQRSIGKWIKDFLFPEPDPEPAPRLTGKEREEARKRNHESYFERGVYSARLAFDELNDDIWSSPLNFWDNGIPEQYGMLEEIEDAFSGPALVPEKGGSGAEREYALYIRSRRNAAIGARRLGFAPKSVRAEIEHTADSQVPDFPEYDEGMPLTPGSERYFEQRREAFEHRVEAIKDLRRDMAQGGQSREHMLGRVKAQYDWIYREFHHGPVQPAASAIGAFSAYQRYFEARTGLAKEAQQSQDIPPEVRDELKRQAEAPVPKEPPAPVDPEWDAMEAERRKVPLESPSWQDLFDLDVRIGNMRSGIDSARIAIRSRQLGQEVSSVETHFVHTAAREEYGKLALSPRSGDSLVQKYYARYSKMRRELAGLIGLAHLTPPDLIKQIMAAKTEDDQPARRVLARDSKSVLERRDYHLMATRLKLDPDIQAQAEAIIRRELAGERLFDHLGAALVPAVSGDPGASSDPAFTYPKPKRAKAPAPVDPADPPGFERPAEEATVGELVGAVRRVPQVHDALLSFDDATWGSLGPGTQRTLVVGSVVVGVGALGGALATSRGREQISKLSGVSLPVPKVPWLAFEFRSTKDDLIGIGVHVDVGALLPARLGFGAARPQDPGITLYPRDR